MTKKKNKRKAKQLTVRQEQAAFRLEQMNVAVLYRRRRGSAATDPESLLRDANRNCIEQFANRIRRAMAKSNQDKRVPLMTNTRTQYVSVAVDREIKNALEPLRKKYRKLASIGATDEQITAQIKLPALYAKRHFDIS
jgi:hypothetical protein